ncbi:hypothetical protein OSJ77_01165, partial [Phyllobacterium sp. 0TCS1.6C]|uniref:hypothetical protein n=1 Tax=Phyllobacterium sp. 0TCS1.6C TaxID=2995638 RepID=UPI0022644471
LFHRSYRRLGWLRLRRRYGQNALNCGAFIRRRIGLVAAGKHGTAEHGCEYGISEMHHLLQWHL